MSSSKGNSLFSPRRLLLAALAAAASISPASASTVESASFGQDGKIAPDGSLKNWVVSGRDYTPELMSDRIILTPPYPGHKQGGVWTERRLNVPEFLVDFEFRATGPDNGQGQLQVWYTKENQAQIGHHNMYGVGKFTGLGLLIDQLGGRGGGIRAYLNDGATDFSRSDIEKLPFGHCDYPYRNLGAFSKLQLHQDAKGLEVLVDGRSCFRADNVFLPQDHYFGITANTGETPDSFELLKFVTHTGVAISRDEPVRGQQMGSPPQQQQQNDQHQHQQPMMQKPPPPKVGNTADSPMLNDIHSHMVAMGHVPGVVEEIKQKVGFLDGKCATRDELRALESKLDRITQLVEKIATEQKDWSGHFDEIHKEIRSGTNMFLEKIPKSMGDAVVANGPSVMQLVFIVIAAQLVLGLGYVVYKRRESSPKKYL